MNDIVKNLPQTPGIYKMLDKEGRIIYVGKALNIRNRVKSYFQKEATNSARTRKMVEHIKNIECIQTDSELEALILETNLIKDLRPRYNILMKDDKSYVYIKVDLTEDFPRIHVIREKDLARSRDESPKAKYFGPKLASSKVYETLRVLKKIFPFRHCKLGIEWDGEKFESSSKAHATQTAQLQLSPNKDLVQVKNRVIDFPCLDYFIKRCPGPCIGAIAPFEYKKIVQQIINFLTGKSDEIENQLKKQMEEAASQKLFEKAARIRDKLFAVQSITEQQKITDPHRQDTDVINFTTDIGHLYFNIFMIRGGKLINQENFSLDALEMNIEDATADVQETLESFLLQYYEKAVEIPKEILIPEEISSKDTLEKWLMQKKGERVRLITPQRGEKNKLLELSLKNAASFGKQYRIKWLAEQRGETALARLAEVLGMKDKVLKRIEGFDISHLGGNETVASMVVFENGLPKSSDYRHFKMRTVSGKPDDYKSIEEVFTRRLKYLQAPKNISVRKATKKSGPLIKEWTAKEKWTEITDADVNNFCLLYKEKEPVGMLRLFEVKKGIFEISALYIVPEQRGNKLSFAFLEKVIHSVKNKRARFYLGAEAKLADHYAGFGFTEVHDAPEKIKERNAQFEKIDNKKYTILALYKAKKKSADPSFSARPDLIVVDGGKGQLGMAVGVLKKLQLDIPVISLAKRLEEIYQPGQSAPLLLEEGDEALKLLQRIRDESHRFAITFQRDLHRKALIQ